MTITGTGFVDVVTVVFGKAKAKKVTVVSETTLTVTTPKHAAGQVSVLVKTKHATSRASAAARFRFCARPVVKKLSPATGPTSGGGTVKLTGSRFTAATKVLFGSTAAAGLKVVSDKSLTVIAPPGKAGKVSVRVVGPGGTSSKTAKARYSYTKPLTVTTSRLPAGTVGKTYTATLAATGGKSPFSWKATGLPAGLSLAGKTGKLTGTPSLAGAYAPKFTVTDHAGKTASAQLTLNVTGSAGHERAVRIAAGDWQTCALTSAGAVKCWGASWDGTETDHMTPVGVAGLGSGVTAITAGYDHMCALTAAGAVKCWGTIWTWSCYGDECDGTAHPLPWPPVTVAGLGSGVTAIVAGGDHTCALTAAGAVKCWGTNRYGELGDGTRSDRSTSVGVVGLGSGVASITAGSGHTCALTRAGAVKCWGWNESGGLGDGTRVDSSTPVDVYGLGSGVTAIAAGGGYTCALTAAGAVKCWGDNYYGQLGDGTRVARLTPVGVSGLGSGATAIAAGGEHACALTGAGAVKCWGSLYNMDTEEDVRLPWPPATVAGLGSGVTAIAAGGSHTCALIGAGAIKCWGENGAGELGDGTTTWRTAPVSVIGFS